jgi:hypothetical protein
MDSYTFSELITFTRSTNATLVDGTGLLTYAPNNLLLRSEEFENAGWVKSLASVTANVTTSPDGTTNADRLTADGSNNPHDLRQTVTYTAATHTFSVYAKKDTNDFVQLRFGAAAIAGGTGFANFDLNAGTVGTIGTGLSTASITPVGNGWYRCAITGTTLAASTFASFYIVSSATAPSAQGNTLTTSVFLWGAQLEQVTYQTTPGTYNQTVASAYYGPRFDYNPVTLAPRGLLIEEQRTNLALQSQTFDTGWSTADNVSITANTAIAPDGTTTADTLAETAATGIHTASQISSAAGVLTLSVFAKANSGTPFLTIGLSRSGTDHCSATFNLGLGTNTASQVHGAYSGVSATITAAAQGFYRCTLTVTTDTATVVRIGLNNTGTPTAGNRSFGSAYLGVVTNSIFIYGAQLEAGAFPTSYIPTVASTVTRAADVAAMTGTNFSSWYNASEGTIVAQATAYGNKASSVLVRIQDATAVTNFIAGRQSATGTQMLGQTSSSGGLTAGLASTNFTLGVPFVIAVACAPSNIAASVNGGAVGTSTAMTTMPVVDRLNISEGGPFHIRSITFYPYRLADFQLQALTV